MNDNRECRHWLLTITLTAVSLLYGTSACGAHAGPDRAAAAMSVAGATAEEEAPSAAGAGAGAEPVVESDWCAARQVLVTKCQRCHTAPPEHGAPFPLVSYDDTQIVGARGEARFVAIEAAVSKEFMPPSFIALEPPVAGLVEDERAALLAWCRTGGLPAPPGACDAEP